MENRAYTGGSLFIDRTWERCGGSTVGEVRKDVVEGRTLVQSLEGTPDTNFDWGIFCTQHQSPYFRVRVPNEGSIEKFSWSKLPLSITVLEGCQIFWRSTHWY